MEVVSQPCFYHACSENLSIAPRPTQDGTTEEDGLWAAVMADDDASVVTVGHTRGNFSGVFNGGVVDLVVMKLDAATGTEIWRHQVWPDSHADMYFLGARVDPFCCA